MRSRLFALLVLLAASPMAAQSTAEWRSWNKPVKPFRIIDDIYYVGASDVTSYLITSPRGHILLDGGFPETAPMILANIKALGFKASDVKVLLSSHAHFDHAGGLAALKRATGATFVSSVADSGALARGGHGDFNWGDTLIFPAVTPSRTIRNGDSVTVGSARLVAHLMPGHTKGCTTWTTTARDGAAERAVVFSCSLSVPGYRLVGNTAYPDIVTDYRHSFAAMRALPCDMLLASHGGVFHLSDKMKLAGRTPNPFVETGACARYADASEKAFDQLLREQQAGKR